MFAIFVKDKWRFFLSGCYILQPIKRAGLYTIETEIMCYCLFPRNSHLKKCPLSIVEFLAPQMAVGKVGNLASARSALDEPLFYKIRLVHLLYGTRILAESRSNSADAHRAALELVDDDAENLIVNLVETVFVDIQSLESRACNAYVYN